MTLLNMAQVVQYENCNLPIEPFKNKKKLKNS